MRIALCYRESEDSTFLPEAAKSHGGGWYLPSIGLGLYFLRHSSEQNLNPKQVVPQGQR
jgi:hypothetical protein